VNESYRRFRPGGAVVNSRGWSAAEPLEDGESHGVSPNGANEWRPVAPLGLDAIGIIKPGVALRSTPGY
jgi:hypothetical protein